jgi:hypothetical protein
MSNANTGSAKSEAARLYMAALVPLALLSWHLRFFVDDAFIAFRYAENWAAGLGPVYHAGDFVEGFSDLAWVFLLSLAARLGAPVDTAAHILSAVCALATAALVVDLLRALPISRAARLGGALTVGLSADLAAWATGGLETALFTLALFGLWRELQRERSSLFRAALFGVLLVSARVEGVLWLGGIASTIALSDRTRARARLRLLAPGLIAFALIELWRYATYGEWLPNTVHAKAGLDGETLSRGAYYIASWLSVSILPLVAAALCLRALRSPAAEHARAAAALTLGGVAFAIFTGGDWMPFFRFLAPTVPFLAIIIAAGIHGKRDRFGESDSSGKRGKTSPLWALPVLGCLSAFGLHILPRSAREALDFRGFAVGYETELERLAAAQRNIPTFRAIGRALRDHAAEGDSIVLGAIGAIGYESGLIIHDRNGLVDAQVAATTTRIAGRSAGHERRIPRHRFCEPPLNRRPTWFGARAMNTIATSRDDPAARQVARGMLRNVLAHDPSDAALLEACLPELIPFGSSGSLLLLRRTADAHAARAYWGSLGFPTGSSDEAASTR